MTNETVTTMQYEEFLEGIVDMLGLADLAVNDEVYIQTDDTVSIIYAGCTSAVAAKRLGWVVRPYTHGTDSVVGVQSKYHRRCTRTATESITAGDDVKISLTDPTEVAVWVQGIDYEEQKIGKALTSAWEDYDVEIAEV